MSEEIEKDKITLITYPNKKLSKKTTNISYICDIPKVCSANLQHNILILTSTPQLPQYRYYNKGNRTNRKEYIIHYKGVLLCVVAQ